MRLTEGHLADVLEGATVLMILVCLESFYGCWRALCIHGFHPLAECLPGGRGVNFEVPLTDALDDQGVNNSNVLI
jgi:hypothetical protein